MASNSFSATPTSTPAPQSTGGEREKHAFSLPSLCSIGVSQRTVIALNICEVGDLIKSLRSLFRFYNVLCVAFISSSTHTPYSYLILAVLRFPTFSAFAILLFLSAQCPAASDCSKSLNKRFNVILKYRILFVPCFLHGNATLCGVPVKKPWKQWRKSRFLLIFFYFFPWHLGMCLCLQSLPHEARGLLWSTSKCLCSERANPCCGLAQLVVPSF